MAEYRTVTARVTVSGASFDVAAVSGQSVVVVDPYIEVERVDGGVKVIVTDAHGATQAVIFDGPQGQQGETGEDGVSPTVSVAEITDGHRVTITDAEGDHAFDVMDGAPGGPKGDTGNGIASVRFNADYTLTITMTDGTSCTTPSIRGATGATGPAGQSAYEAAQTGGYTGSASDFYADLAAIDGLAAALAAI